MTVHEHKLLCALVDMIGQHCYLDGVEYDSRGLTANAEAIRLLAELGYMKIKSESGRCVVATLPERMLDYLRRGWPNLALTGTRHEPDEDEYEDEDNYEDEYEFGDDEDEDEE